MRLLTLATLAALACVACANPSPLDHPAPEASGDRDTHASDAAIEPWRAIARRARVLDAGADELDAALDDRATPLAARAEALEAWAAARGRFVRVPGVRAMDDGDRDMAASSLALEMLGRAAGDDRALEAALYLAQRMRRDGDDMLAALSAVAIARKAAAVRPQPPAFAARYAPTDGEAIRAFAAEAMAVSRMVAWSRTDDADRVTPVGGGASYKRLAASAPGDPLADWSWLADAPADRAGFVALLHRRAAASSPEDLAADLPKYADKLFGAVDDYQRWLTSGR